MQEEQYERELKRKQRNRYYRKTQNMQNRYKPWSKEDVKMVMEHKISDHELSKLIQRSVKAIQTMRRKQKNLNICEEDSTKSGE